MTVVSLTRLSEALNQLFGQIPALPEAVELPLAECLGRALARPIVADIDIPPFDNSAMDGYAVRVTDIPGELPVSQYIPAGVMPKPLALGTAARIFTGAMLPPGADTVVMQEDATELNDKVQILSCFTLGSHVRKLGTNISAGGVVLPVGRVLTPQDLGVAASVGSAILSVRRPLRVAIITTGDELIQPGQSRQSWQIFNSNGIQLFGQVRALGMEALEFGSLADDPVVIGDTLEYAAQKADCIITSGGVSVGEGDHVRNQITARGNLTFWKLAIKPGKPLAFGSVAGCPVFGLPGNPVSSWVTFGLVVKPWLLRAQGADVPPLRRLEAIAEFDVARPGAREEFLRVYLSIDQPPRAYLAGDQGSGAPNSVSDASALAVIPIGGTVAVGDQVTVLMINELLSPLAAG